MKISEGNVLTMVDNGATHNFMSEDITRRIELNFLLVQAQLKQVNSPLDSVISVAKKINVCIGEWVVKVDFTIV